MGRFVIRALKFGVGLGLVGAFVAIAAGVVLIRGFGQDLPDHAWLVRYSPPLTTRAHAGDGRILAEFRREHRLFVPIAEIPLVVRNAFLSAEDKSFYKHPGLDPQALIRAMVRNLQGLGEGRRLVGGSTITQQVAKNVLLTNEVSYERKIKEAILSFRIERALSKDKILELYLNEIYLGEGAYGVAAAAMTYFGKSLDEVTPEEAAYMGALPKAPSNYHPLRRHDAAIARRNWVLGRMAEDGAISAAAAAAAKARPLTVASRPEAESYRAPWFAEEVRRALLDLYGEGVLYGGGLSVRATIDPALQDLAEGVLRYGLEAYDRRHGYRGPVAEMELGDGWPARLAEMKTPPGAGARRLAVVLQTSAKQAKIGFADGSEGRIPYAELRWARPTRKDQRVGPQPKRASAALSPGDVVLATAVEKTAKGKAYPPGVYALSQTPDVEGALVALDPHTGRVLAMTGGYSAERSQFNRATQAARQPGSAIKPFIYLAALEAGYTPATQVLDAPYVIEVPGQGIWKPSNYSGKIYGPSPMRLGLEKSRNLMTVRLAEHVGMQKVMDVARRFGVGDNMTAVLSAALGASEVTVLDLTTAYGMLANGGKRIVPSFIDSVQDREGRVIYRHDQRLCLSCAGAGVSPAAPPELPEIAEQVADPRQRYQIVSMLQGVVERGTGRRVYMPGRPLAGKTGTTNDLFDAWFVGFSSNLVVGVYVGFDQPRTLGPKEAGGSTAAPIFRRFMEKAWELRPGAPFAVPPGIEFARVSRTTGLPARGRGEDVVLEAFLPGTQPREAGGVIGGGIAGTGGARPVPPFAEATDEEDFNPNAGAADAAPPTSAPFVRQTPVGRPADSRPTRRRQLGRVY